MSLTIRQPEALAPVLLHGDEGAPAPAQSLWQNDNAYRARKSKACANRRGVSLFRLGLLGCLVRLILVLVCHVVRFIPFYVVIRLDLLCCG